MPDPARGRHPSPEKIAQKLLALLESLQKEIHHGSQPFHRINLDSALDRDLGFDSLARAEMLLRIEKQFEVVLSEQVLSVTETPRDLLRVILNAYQQDPVAAITTSVQPLGPLSAIESLPERAETLPEVLNWHAQRHGSRPHLYLYSNEQHYQTLTYGDLKSEARQMAGRLLAEGGEPGSSVAIMLPTSRDYFVAFFGVLLAGCIPVPIYPPVRASLLEDHLQRHVGILNNARVSLLISIPEAQLVSRLLKSHVMSLKGVISVADQADVDYREEEVVVTSADTAFLQYTSGSTGSPKGVILTHHNLLSNIRGFGQALAFDSTDIGVSWLPLYHDMGLIGAWLGSLYHGIPLVIMSPMLFLTRPVMWLKMIHRHRATVSAAPNFAFELCLSKIPQKDLVGLDLSCLRVVLNGAEPVSPATLHRFAERFAQQGLRPQALLPVYGLAESSVALTIPPLERLAKIDRVQREPLMHTGKAVPVEEGVGPCLEFASVGLPLAGHQVRVVDSRGQELPERQEGRLQFQGPSATSGYFRNPGASRSLFFGQWLDSGDRAYIAGGEVYITGRDKDIIIRAGRNLYPHELEAAVGELEGIRKGCVAVFACRDGSSGERLVVAAETRETDQQARNSLSAQIQERSVEMLGVPADEIVLLPPHCLPKTSSGKIRRAATSQLYSSNRLGRNSKALALQVAGLMLRGLWPQLRKSAAMLLERLYGTYVWSLFGVGVLVVWLLMLVIPKVSWCRRIAKSGCSIVSRLGAGPLVVEGLEHLPQSPCVLVANHASYLDGLLLTACLPHHFGYVAKVELLQHFTVGLLLKRIGTEFVERFDMQRGIADARRLVERVAEGRSLVFFPEGRFDRIPGLKGFHMGAFIAAVQSGVPIVPVSILGSRSKLREGTWMPRRGRVRIQIGKPIYPDGDDWSAAVKLRDRARQVILLGCGEPDRSAGPEAINP